MNFRETTAQAKAHVEAFYNSNGAEQLLYHNIHHTQNVVAAATRIAQHYQLNEFDLFVVEVAAWFHDTGYCSQREGSNHEEKGAELAEQFLSGRGIDPATIAIIKNCILSTIMPQHPVSLVEQIVCDADLFHFGTDEFSSLNKQMRKEYEVIGKKPMDKAGWRRSTIQLLQSHQYHTDYCRALLNAKKQLNLEKLLKKEKSDLPGPISAMGKTANTLENQFLANSGKAGSKSTEKPSRGIETMFRIAVTNHQRLSDMADSKANIMISVNAIIISLVIGLVVRKLETTPVLIVPTMVLLSGCVTAAIFSVLATRPKIPNGYFTPEQLSQKTVNLLFFGNFYKMDFGQYYEGMKQVMADGEFLYASLIRDIHSQGKVLGNKYKLLRISYTIFMYTLITGIISFAVATIFFM